MSEKMKILACTLLLTTALFLHFDGSNASGIRMRLPDELTPTLVHNPPGGPDTWGPPHKEVRYRDYAIKLWLDRRDQRTVLKANYRDNYAPDPFYVAMNDFFVKLIDVEGYKIVGYITPDNKLFGVRAPNPNARPHDLEPSSSIYYILHRGRAYKVRIDPATNRMEDINLVPANIHRKPENQQDRKSTEVTLGNVSFMMFYNLEHGVLGAEPMPGHHYP